MHLRNLDGTEEFHVPREAGKAFLATGNFTEVKAEPAPKQETRWRIIHRVGGPPVIRAECPNCKSDTMASGPRAPYNKLFHACNGGPEACPYELATEYFNALKAWKKDDEQRAKNAPPKPKRPAFSVIVGT